MTSFRMEETLRLWKGLTKDQRRIETNLNVEFLKLKNVSCLEEECYMKILVWSCLLVYYCLFSSKPFFNCCC